MTVSFPKTREDLVAVTRRMVVDYYHLDNELFLAYLADDCVWVMPNHVICRGQTEVRAQFEQGWVMPPSDSYDMSFELLDTVIGDAAVVMGSYHLLSDTDSDQLMAMSQHLSAVWCPRDEGWRIVYLHVSAEWVETAPGEVYPIEASRQTWRYAQAMIARGIQGGSRPLSIRGTSGNLVSVDPWMLLFARADGKRCVLHMEDESFEAACSISELEEKLPAEFVRVHRSYLVNRGRISVFDGTHIKMADGSLVPIPAKRRTEIRRMLE